MVEPAVQRLRRDHIRHERQLQVLGGFFYIPAVFTLPHVAARIALFVMGRDPLWTENGPIAWSSVLAFLAIGLASTVVGYGVTNFRPWVYVPALFGTCLLLLPPLAPVGLMAFYLLLSRKGRTIFAPDYAEVIAATPSVKYVHSRQDLVLAVLAVLLLVVLPLMTIPAFLR